MPSVVINASTNGDNQIIAGKAGMVIDVLGYELIPQASVVAKFTDGGGGTALTGPMSLPTAGRNVPVIPPSTFGKWQEPWFSTLTGGTDLTLNLGAGTQVSGFLVYRWRRL